MWMWLMNIITKEYWINITKTRNTCHPSFNSLLLLRWQWHLLLTSFLPQPEMIRGSPAKSVSMLILWHVTWESYSSWKNFDEELKCWREWSNRITTWFLHTTKIGEEQLESQEEVFDEPWFYTLLSRLLKETMIWHECASHYTSKDLTEYKQ